MKYKVMKQAMRFVLPILSVLVSTAHAQDFWQQTNGPYGGTVTALAFSGTNLFAGTVTDEKKFNYINGEGFSGYNT